MFVRFIWNNRRVRIARKYWRRDKGERGVPLLKQNKVLIIKLL